MKILLANYRYYPSGGPEAYLFNVMELFRSAGHTVVPFSVASGRNEPSEFAPYFPKGKDSEGSGSFDSVKKTPRNAIRMASCAFYNREAYRNLRRLIRDEHPDVVYVLQQVNALSPSVFKACKDEGVPVVHRISDFNMFCPRFDFLRDGEVCMDCLDRGLGEALRHDCFHASHAATSVRVLSMRYHRARRLFGCVDAFVCPTEFTAGVLKKGGIAPGKIHVISTFAPSTRENSERGGDSVLYLGRISPEKGIEHLVRAVANVPEVSLDITGDTGGEYPASVVALAESELGKRVVFRGFVSGEAKESLFADAFCVACPSICVENMPNTVLEAYAHGLPAVAFDVGCMGEIVEDGVTGFVVPYKDEEALAERIRALAEDRALARHMGENGRRLYEERFSPKGHLDALASLFADVAARAGNQDKENRRAK